VRVNVVPAAGAQPVNTRFTVHHSI
jgi:hypothetical protein